MKLRYTLPALADLDQILEGDRNSVQRADRMPRADRLVGRLGGEPRLVAVNLGKGMELLVLCLDAIEQRLDQIDGR